MYGTYKAKVWTGCGVASMCFDRRCSHLKPPFIPFPPIPSKVKLSVRDRLKEQPLGKYGEKCGYAVGGSTMY